MNDENHSSDKDSKSHRNWIERLGQALQGELKDQDQLREVLQQAQNNHIIDIDALSMIDGVIEVAEMQVRDIMIPRSQMVVVERDADLKVILETVVDSAHSRFPAVGENRDEVVGILLAKDLLPYFLEGEETRFNLRDILRPAIFIPESKRLNVLLKEFRASRNHIAIVVDEYGGVAGLVTIEDVLEQIVGNIEDEHDIEEDAYIFQHHYNDFTVKAITPIEDFNESFQVDFSDEEFDTIGGLVMNGFGHMPKKGETLDLGDFHFRVLRASSRQIYLLQVSRHDAAQATSQAGTAGGG